LAIYHLRVKVTGRQIANPKPGGAVRRSAVAAAAYRSGERLFDNSQGKWFQRDAEENHAIEHKAILAPEGAPAWVFDRTALWNAVERGEMNKDGSIRDTAQLFREVEITLPRELSREERIALVEGFAREQFVAAGMVADIAIHNKTGSDGREQPHAHIMLTMRRLDPARETGFAKAKAREWNIPAELDTAIRQRKAAVGSLEKQAKAAPLPASDAAALVAARGELRELVAQTPLVQWRAAWTAAANAALQAHGSAERIDHRTLVDQRDEALANGDLERARQLDREPQKPLGVAGHLEGAYRYMKDRISTWVAIEQRERMTRYLQGMRRRDPMKAARMIERLTEWTEEVIDRFNRTRDDRDLVPEVRLER
jgi:hypothetical protein